MSIVNNYVHLPREDDVVAEKCDDGIHVYATEVLSLCLIWHGFHDLLERVMENECCYTGRFYWSFSSQAIDETMEKKQ